MNHKESSRDELLKKYPFLKTLIQLAQKDLKAQKIYLFGSRARGDARENSDFDIAILTENAPSTLWLNFCVNWDTLKETLHAFDLILLNSIDDKFKDKILKEGVLLYG